MYTFSGRSCNIIHNSDMSGSIIITSPETGESIIIDPADLINFIMSKRCEVAKILINEPNRFPVKYTDIDIKDETVYDREHPDGFETSSITIRYSDFNI